MHGHDQICICILQICDRAICKPFYLIFSLFFSIESGIFPTESKVANVVSITKRNDKHNVKNYRPVSLFRIFRKIFGHLIHNEMYSFFIEKDLISPN